LKEARVDFMTSAHRTYKNRPSAHICDGSDYTGACFRSPFNSPDTHSNSKIYL